MVLEEPQAVVDPVADDDGPHGISCIRHVDLQVNVVAVPTAFHLQPLPAFIGHVLEVQADVVSQALRRAGCDRNGAVDAVPLAIESQSDGFRDLERRGFVDLDRHREILDRDRSRQAERSRQASQCGHEPEAHGADGPRCAEI